MNSPTVETLQVPGANLYYEVSGSGPVLLMIPGAPADAGIFGGIRSILEKKYTTVTYDPRGVSRSTLEGPAEDWNVTVHGDDAHRLLAALGSEPAYVLGCSGGAMIGLDLIARYPDQVRKLVAHEPPSGKLLPDSARWQKIFQDVYDSYRTDGAGVAMMKFIAAVQGDEPGSAPSMEMPDMSQMPPEALEAMGRMQANLEQFFAHILLPAFRHVPDVAALQPVSAKVVVAVGAASPGQLPHEAGVVLAERLGTKPADFPGDHQGFNTHAPEFAEAVDKALQD